ncbi:zinc metalloprotease HtpX [Kitasatospora purpeofusca]|uniref:zinc metalloprotease HtpX n=1 Tax=Kitasatospora purpeofusca TaxID=67352 RepID=UPI002252C384|nr:zinc metalloprotease HtpX [Kitasatospora purpeofusca]MCX4752710.1 zinc metalloprotease HtpX [Kitasatospora purpeofusca]WSR32269.1 zinc metalloprotease HtpX [Kitasatospora purpeofusca]WSR40299.1 zinc metalloprotease HtpX [Kitasatospora purpeofusca]
MSSSGQHTRFAPDRGLTGRMVGTMFLIGLLYVGFTGLLIVLLRGAWPIVVLISGGLFVAQFWFSDRITERAMGAHRVTPEQYPQLHGAVDRLCALADMPKPRVAVADNDMPNAFATGRNPQNAVVCVTTGLLRRLEPEELEGVLAHELSHVAHRDVAVMTVAGFLGVLAGAMTRIAMYGGFMGGGRNSNDSNAAIAALVVPLVSIAVYAISFLLTRLLSRYRELAADRAAAQLTGRPSALASALTKVTGQIAAIPTRDLRQAQAYNAFWFAPALSAREAATQLFSTHPSLEQRLAQLAKISSELGR